MTTTVYCTFTPSYYTDSQYQTLMSAQMWNISPCSFCFLELFFSHLPHKLFAGATNTPLISLIRSQTMVAVFSPVIPLWAVGLSYLFAIDHSGVAHTLESSRWGEATFAIKQRGAVWNLRKRQLPPCPWAGDQTMRKPASDTQHLPLAPWCKQHANPPLTCICQPGG